MKSWMGKISLVIYKAIKQAQQLKAVATKSEDLSTIPQTCKPRALTFASCSLTSSWLAHIHVHMHTGHDKCTVVLIHKNESIYY